MPLPNVLLACFKGPKESALVASRSTPPSLACATSQSSPFDASLPSVAGRASCASREADASPAVERNIPYTPRDTSQRPSFCVELPQPSVRPEQRSKVEYTTADELVKGVQSLRWLGQGAQGVVYEGIWQGATVAVKFSIVEDLDATAYELLFSRLLSHPNVVQTYVAKVAVLDEQTIRRRTEGCSGRENTLSGPPGRPSFGERAPGPAAGGGGGAAVGPAPAAAAAAITSSLYRPGIAAAAAGAADGGAIPSVIARCGSGVHASSSAAAAAASASSPDTRKGAAAGGDCKGGAPPALRGGGGGSAAAAAAAGTGFSGGPLTALGGGASNSDPELVQTGALQRAGRSDSFQSDDGFGNPFGRRSTFNDVREVLATMGARPGHFITQMVMEHCDHGSLHAAIQRGIFKPSSRWGPKLALRALIRTVREVAQGMFHLHSNNVLHGDLKPANVLLINSRKDRRGYVAKLSDFGMAQFCPKDHISNAPWGTLVYMAPERLLQGHLFPASDVYSFGVMLWEMYHGRRPYEGMHAAQIVMACAQGCTCLEWSKDSCSDIVRLSRACMAASPHDRPSFEWLMHELAVLESRVRLDGMRVSKSMDAGSTTSRPCGRLSSDVASQRLHRGCNSISGMQASKQRTSLDTNTGHPVTVTGASTAAAAAAGPAAAATVSATSSRRCNKEAAGAGGGTLPGGRRYATEKCCHSGHHALPRPVQPPYGSGGAAGGSGAKGALPVLPPSGQITSGAAPGRPQADAAGLARSAGVDSASGGGGGLVTTGDVEAGRRSSGGSAAAIAAALAQQPEIASAVVSELLALLQLQQQQQDQQPSQQQPLNCEETGQRQQAQRAQVQREDSCTTGVWAAAATTSSSRNNNAAGAGCRGSNSGTLVSSRLWRRSTGGLGAEAAAPPPQPPAPPQPQGFPSTNPPTSGPFQGGTPPDLSCMDGLRPRVSCDIAQHDGHPTAHPPVRSISGSPGAVGGNEPLGSDGGGEGGSGGSCEAAAGVAVPAVLLATAGAAVAAGPAAACGAAIGVLDIARIARSSTDSALGDVSAGGGGGEAGGGGGGRAGWDSGAAAAAVTAPLTDDGPLLVAATNQPEAMLQPEQFIDPQVPLQQQQQQQQPPGYSGMSQAHLSAVTSIGVPLLRRRSSNLAVARRSGNSPGWECPTISEEPL